MKRLAFMLLFLGGITSLPAQENGIDQDLELVTYPSGEQVIVWYGHVGRSYFLQVSDPADHLKKWHWANIIEGGEDHDISHQVEGTADKGFFRLKYTDQVPGPNEDLDSADFDCDGISNKDEVEPPEGVAQTDPLNPDTDGDGLPDGWELAHGLNPNDSSDAANLFPGSNLTNLQAFNAGVQANPNATPTNKDGDGLNDDVDADPNDTVVDWKRAPEASYAVIVLEQEDFSGYQYSLEPEASNWLQPAFSASIDSTNMVLWNDMNQANGSTSWSGRHRVWKSGVWSDLMSGSVTNNSFIMSASYVFDNELNTTRTIDITVNPGSWNVSFASGGYAIGHAGYDGTAYGLEYWDLEYWDENGHAVKKHKYDMTVTAGADPVATLWSPQLQQGVIHWQVNPIAPPTLTSSGLPLSPESFQAGGVCAAASPGGAIAVLGGNMTTDERKWKIWSPPSVPGTDSPSWERQYVDATTGRCLQINAIEDGGSVTGVSWDSSSGWWSMNNRRLLVIDGGTEQELPSGTGQSPHVHGLCRVYVGNTGDSRLVATGSNLWVKKNGQWHVAEHKPEIGDILAVAKDGVLLGGHSIWRNGKEVGLDKLVENQKVDGPDSAARYTNLRAYAMNALGTIVALADDALNPGTGKKTLLMLLPVDLDVNGNGTLDDSCDGLATYLPGYEGDQSILHTGDSFGDVQFAGPQEMKLIIPGLGTAAVDSATFKILNPTSTYGFCGNAIATGGTSDDEAINSGADFSFESAEDTREIAGTIEANRIWAPIYCKDYGAWCQVEITLKKDGVVIGGPNIFTLPHDNNGDKIADLWQRDEIQRWNQQFRLTKGDQDWVDPEDFDTWWRAFDPLVGAELPDSDGDDGPMPAMADKGDDLPALVEYRGYFLDGGPNCSTPDHRRLSVARKELLVECSEMEGIASTTLRLPPGDSFTDQGNDPNTFAQGYTLNAPMSQVAAFFAKEGPATGNNPKYFPGAAIDMWWVKDKLNDMGYVVYENGAMGSTHKYSGPDTDRQRSDNKARNGWLSIASDEVLKKQDPISHDQIYGGGEGVAVLAHYSNRNAQCRDFIKLAVQGRKGFVGNDGGFYTKVNEAAREQDERGEPDRPTYQGSAIFVNSLSEQQVVTTQAGFTALLEYCVAHELAHLFIVNDGNHFVGNNNVLSVNGGTSLPTSFVQDEITNTNLRQRASINRDSDGKPQP